MQYVPRLPDWVTPRPRLYGALDTAAAGGLVLVHGAHGSGKTVAVAEWARQRAGAGAWVTLDPSTRSRRAVWRRILRALELDDSSRLLAEFESSDPGAFREAIGWALSEEPRVIVLDETDHLDDPEFAEDVRYLVASSAAGFVLIGLAPFFARDALPLLAAVELSPAELALDEQETAAVLAAVGVPAPLAPYVHERASGWVQGTLAVGRALSEGTATRAFRDVVDDILERESSGALVILRGLPGDVQRVARLAAVLGPAPAEALGALAPAVDIDGALAELVSAGLGMWTETERGGQFRLAPHLASVLERGAPETRDSEVIRAAARLAEESGRSADAARLLRSISDWSALRQLAQRSFREALVMDQQDWLAVTRTLPVVVLQREPVLAVLHTLLVNADPRSGASQLRATVALALSHIGNRLQSSPDPVDAVWTTVSLLGAQRVGGRYGAALKTATTLDSLLHSLTARDREEVEPLLPTALVHIGTTRLYSGHVAESREDFQLSVRSPLVSEWGVLHAASAIALTFALEGEFEHAAEAVATVRAAPKPRSWHGTYSASGTHLAEALLAVERGDADTADERLDAIERHFETIEHWPLMLWSRAQSSMLRGVTESAEWELAERIRRRARRAPTSEWMTALLLAQRVDLLLATGQDARALRLLDSARSSTALPVRVARARVRLFAGEPDAAAAQAARILDHDDLPVRWRLHALLVSAVAHSRLGVVESADAASRAAALLVESHGLRSPLTAFPAGDLEPLGLLRADPAADPSADPFAARPSLDRLTAAESAVLAALATHSSASSIASELYLSPNTVKAHLRSIYRKLGASSRAQALARARTAGLL
ncbi:AAA family ATPase [Salinibacterium soli]|uniref:AAA family ATPase n=1 Tax=Antiquaquibacter soli TaxID=3064523 RepID=A0ABT9BNF6_9MICO|nr:AAA family ATPase [Protaetiibacter sp. WY-16]MDO7882568.1 AAA family ATPase [Protaetiibacter sp. WY-16]